MSQSSNHWHLVSRVWSRQEHLGAAWWSARRGCWRNISFLQVQLSDDRSQQCGLEPIRRSHQHSSQLYAKWYLELVIDPFTLSSGLSESINVKLMDLGQLGDNVISDFFISGVLLICNWLCFQVGLLEIVEQVVNSLNCIVAWGSFLDQAAEVDVLHGKRVGKGYHHG